MDSCGCRYEPILGPNYEWVGGNIIYCAKHAAVEELYQALNALWLKTEICDYNHAEYYEALRIIDLVDEGRSTLTRGRR